jgi:hypothetical protein
MIRDRSEESRRALVAHVPIENEGVLFLRSKLHARPLVLTRVLLIHLWREPVGETHLSVVRCSISSIFFRGAA